jgi:hypothetical protein
MNVLLVVVNAIAVREDVFKADRRPTDAGITKPHIKEGTWESHVADPG